MTIVAMLVMGGVVYGGVRALTRPRNKQKFIWLQEHEGDYTRKTIPVREGMNIKQIEQTVNHEFAVSSLSLGLAVSGSLVYTPLLVASIPLTIYGLIPMVEHSYNVIFRRSHGALVVAGSVVVIGGLLASRFFTASFVEWVYFVNRKLWFEFASSYSQFLAHSLGENPIKVWILVQGIEVEIPLDELRPGDTVVVDGEAVA